MVKARAKVERAASRNPNVNVSQSAVSSAATAGGLSCSQDSQVPDSSLTESQAQEMDEALPSAAVHETVPNRIDLLRSKAAVVGRFMQLMVPILVDVYAASVITPVRVKTLTGLLKAVSFLDGEGLKKVLTVRPNPSRSGIY
jgi:E3 ubiquitin-protein ligase TRIP12